MRMINRINRLLISAIVRSEMGININHDTVARLEAYCEAVSLRQLKYIGLSLNLLAFSILLRFYISKLNSDFNSSSSELRDFAITLKKSKISFIRDYYTYIQSLVVLYIYSESEL